MKNPTPSKARTSTTKTTTPCCSKIGIKKGPWTPEEDEVLANYIKKEGEGRWRTLPKRAGLLRCGKSCRLRWMNYLRPCVKRGRIAPDEEDLILRLHRLLGNRWALIAGRIPGRTDNEIKNYWNTHLSKKLISQGIDPRTHKPLKLNPNPSTSSHDQPNQFSIPNSDKEVAIRPHPRRAIATKVSENFTMANLDKFQNQIVEDGAVNWPSWDGYVMGLQGMHEQNGEDYMGTIGNEDTFSSFLDALTNEGVFVHHQQHQPNMICPSFQQQPMVSTTQTFNHGSIWEADQVMSSIAGLGSNDGFAHNNHPA